jgi:hypothetical protein
MYGYMTLSILDKFTTMRTTPWHNSGDRDVFVGEEGRGHEWKWTGYEETGTRTSDGRRSKIIDFLEQRKTWG